MKLKNILYMALQCISSYYLRIYCRWSSFILMIPQGGEVGRGMQFRREVVAQMVKSAGVKHSATQCC